MTAWPGLAQDALQLYPYGNTKRQRVNKLEKHRISHTGIAIDIKLVSK